MVNIFYGIFSVSPSSKQLSNIYTTKTPRKTGIKGSPVLNMSMTHINTANTITIQTKIDHKNLV